MPVMYKNGDFYEIKEMNRHKTDVCSILESIYEKQNRAEKQKEVMANHLSPNDIEGDTIPILLYSSLSAEPFSVYGNFGHCFPDSFGSFKTSFFRLEQLKNKSHACLSLLRPLNEYGELEDSILETYSLEKTNFCINVQLEEISIIQCASSKLVNRELIEIEQKY